MWHKTYCPTMPTLHCGGRKMAYQMLASCVAKNKLCLNLRHYNTRHDSVLKEIEQGVRPHLSEGECLLADLPNYQPYTFPPHITYTDLRPDLVLWNNKEKLYASLNLPSAMRPGLKKPTSSRKTSMQTSLKQLRQPNSSLNSSSG